MEKSFDRFARHPKVQAYHKMMDEARHSAETQRAEQIISKMREMQAKDLSDSEIERCLEHCVLGAVLIEQAKQFRQRNIITFQSLYTYNQR